MRRFSLLILAWLISGCTVTNEYGPYSGKVVDAETKEPIEGAAVLMVFYTLGMSLWTENSYYADAVETVTDKNGEFKIPAHRVYALRSMETWDYDGDVSIFKPGYGCFPNHRDALPKFNPAYSFPEGKYVIINLPKLKNARDRYENSINCSIPDTPSLPHKYIDRLIKEDDEYIRKNVKWREL